VGCVDERNCHLHGDCDCFYDGEHTGAECFEMRAEANGE
jgi:hypothetical protein